MREVGGAKIVSALNSHRRFGSKRVWLVAGVVLLVIVGAGLFAGHKIMAARNAASAQVTATNPSHFQYEQAHTTLDTQRFGLDMAVSSAQQELGLGGRERMDAHRGMVFVYNKPSQDLCFWMKGMQFNLDILWVDAGNKIVMVKPDLSPSTYPQSYCPPVPAQTVFEFNAGVINQYHLKAGDTLSYTADN
jgi:uncharacterized membrane protein (UPF0127 family)